MGKETGIQWCDSTVNPTSGCDGCELWKLMEVRAYMLRVMGGPCYAGNQHEGRMAKVLPDLYAADFTEVRMIPGRTAKAAAWSDLTGKSRPDKPWLDGMPRVIFVGDMGDVFSGDVTFDFLKAEIVDVVLSVKGRRHIWMLLTKRPGRMAEFAAWLKAEHDIDWPANLWPGTSITSKASLKRIDGLLKVPSDRRFLSVEPLIEAIDISPWLKCPEISCPDGLAGCEFLHLGPSPIALAIIGGESDQPPHEARSFDLQWARDLIRDCSMAGMKAFLKQLGSDPIESEPDDGPEWPVPLEHDNRGNIVPILRDSHGGDWDEWPADLRVREMPKTQQGQVVSS